MADGENREPIAIEAKLCESPLIDQCMVVGQDQKQLGALVAPSLEGFAELGIEEETVESLAQREDVQERVAREAKRLVSAENGFKAFEHIQGVALVPKPFEVGDEMTNTFKVKRHVVDEKYGELISSLFSN